MDKTPGDLQQLRKDLAGKFGFSTIGTPFPPEVKVKSAAAGGKKRIFLRTAICVGLGLAVLGGGWWLADRRLDALATTLVGVSTPPMEHPGAY